MMLVDVHHRSGGRCQQGEVQQRLPPKLGKVHQRPSLGGRQRLCWVIVAREKEAAGTAVDRDIDEVEALPG
eukprot:5514026-Pyramimonas_sp.AAC.1